jgi:hypothetical protein
VALAVFAAAFAPAPAQALGSAFSCTAVTYQVVGAQLKIGAVDNGELTYTNVGSAHTSSYNAGGYNTVDNFIYAVSSLREVLKIASDGTVEATGIAGIPSDAVFVAGDVTPDGLSLIAFNHTDNSVWSIDLLTVAGTQIGSLGSADVGDFAIVTDGGATTAYGIDTDTGNLVFFDPTVNSIIIDNNSSVEIGPGIAKGAVWADSSGNLTVFVNTTGDVYSVKNPSANSPTVNKVASLGTVTFGNDGMKCALAASAFPEPDESNEALAATGASTLEMSLMALAGLALFAVGNTIRNSRRRVS